MRLVKSIFLYNNTIAQTRHNEWYPYALLVECKFLKHLMAPTRLTVVCTEDNERPFRVNLLLAAVPEPFQSQRQLFR